MLPISPQAPSQGEAVSLIEGLTSGENLFENLILTFLGLETELLSENMSDEGNLLNPQGIQELPEIDFSKLVGELFLNSGMISATITEQSKPDGVALVETEDKEIESNLDAKNIASILDLTNATDNTDSQTTKPSLQILPVSEEEQTEEVMQYELALAQAGPGMDAEPAIANDNMAEKTIPVSQLGERPKQDLQSALSSDADEDQKLQRPNPTSLNTDETARQSDKLSLQQSRPSNQNPVLLNEAGGEKANGEPLKEASQEASDVESEDLQSKAKINANQSEMKSQVTNTVPSEADEQILPTQNIKAQTQTQNLQAAHKVEMSSQMTKAPEIQEQVAIKFVKAVNDKSNEIQIKLMPENLGKINIRLEISDQRVNAMFQADNADTLKLLQADSKSLENALRNAGFDLDNTDLEFSFADQGEASPHDQSNKQDQQNASLFGEEAIEEEDLGVEMQLTDELVSLIPREHTLLSNQQISITA